MNSEALERLGGIADVFLVHNRPIVRHVDDSIVRVMLDRELVLRRARGYAPLPIQINTPLPSSGHPLPAGRGEVRGEGIVLAVGAHLKNTVALSVGNQVFISQHIGDLETEPAYTAFRRVIADFEKLYDARAANHRRRFAPGLSLDEICAGNGGAGIPVEVHASACAKGAAGRQAKA